MVADRWTKTAAAANTIWGMASRWRRARLPHTAIFADFVSTSCATSEIFELTASCGLACFTLLRLLLAALPRGVHEGTACWTVAACSRFEYLPFHVLHKHRCRPN